jgi:hypothetical protein
VKIIVRANRYTDTRVHYDLSFDVLFRGGHLRCIYSCLEQYYAQKRRRANQLIIHTYFAGDVGERARIPYSEYEYNSFLCTRRDCRTIIVLNAKTTVLDTHTYTHARVS